MIILALDQSLSNTGYALGEYTSTLEDYTIIKHNVIKTTNTSLIRERLHKIRIEIKFLIKEYKVDEVITEKIYINRRGAGAWDKLLKVEGIIEELTEASHIRLNKVSTTEWRKALGIENNKKQLLEWFKKDYNHIHKNEHSSEAVCILLAIGMLEYNLTYSQVIKALENYGKKDCKLL